MTYHQIYHISNTTGVPRWAGISYTLRAAELTPDCSSFVVLHLQCFVYYTNSCSPRDTRRITNVVNLVIGHTRWQVMSEARTMGLNNYKKWRFLFFILVPFSFGHCIVCSFFFWPFLVWPSSIYESWLRLLVCSSINVHWSFQACARLFKMVENILM
jgi:hypothetical protein